MDGDEKVFSELFSLIKISILFSFPDHVCDVAADVESDHDYETVDETLVAVVKTAQENVMFY